MAIRYMYGTDGLISYDTNWQIPAKEAWLAEYETQFPQGKCEIKTAYQDKITGVIQDTMVKLATDGVTVHCDRLVSPNLHPTDPNKHITVYDDTSRYINQNS